MLDSILLELLIFNIIKNTVINLESFVQNNCSNYKRTSENLHNITMKSVSYTHLDVYKRQRELSEL